MKRRIAVGAVLLALLLALALRAGYVLMPARLDYGAGWNMYRREPKNSIDALVFGSSMAYCSVIPAALYEQTGRTAFVLAGPEQTFSITYDYIKEALKTQSPSLILLELSGVMFERYMNYTKVNVGYMPASLNRLEATLRGAEREEWAGLFFPLYNYHDRFEDPGVLFRPREDEKQDPLAGFMPMREIAPQSERGERDYETSEETFEANLEALGRILALCSSREIRLVLFQSPSCAALPAWALDRLRAFVGDAAEVVDFNEQFDAMGLDMERDFCDFLHTNVYGAQKLTRALADYLAPNWDAPASPHDDALWQWRVRQLREAL